MPVKQFDIKKIDPPSFGIYGASGSGKTTLLGTIPGVGLVIDTPTTEKGTFVLADKADRIHGVRCEDWKDLEDVYWAIAKRDKQTLPYIDDVKWVALDSATGVDKLARFDVVANRTGTAVDRDPSKLSLPERGEIGFKTGDYICRINALPYMTIVTAQMRKFGGDGETQEPVHLGPNIAPSALNLMLPPLTFLGRLSAITDDEGRTRRALRVGPADGLYMCKVRSLPGKRLPNLIRSPNLGEIMRYLFGDGPRPKAMNENAGILLV